MTKLNAYHDQSQHWDEIINDYLTEDLKGIKPVIVRVNIWLYFKKLPILIKRNYFFTLLKVANLQIEELHDQLNRRILVFLFLPSLVLFLSLICLAIDIRKCLQYYYIKYGFKKRKTSNKRHNSTTMDKLPAPGALTSFNSFTV